MSETLQRVERCAASSYHVEHVRKCPDRQDANEGAAVPAAAWSPLKVELFRSLYIATSIAQIGTWAREAGSPSLMMLLTQGWTNQPDMVGRIARLLEPADLPVLPVRRGAGRRAGPPPAADLDERLDDRRLGACWAC